MRPVIMRVFVIMRMFGVVFVGMLVWVGPQRMGMIITVEDADLVGIPAATGQAHDSLTNRTERTWSS